MGSAPGFFSRCPLRIKAYTFIKICPPPPRDDTQIKLFVSNYQKLRNQTIPDFTRLSYPCHTSCYLSSLDTSRERLYNIRSPGHDPDFTPQCARVQVKRVANARHLDEDQVAALVERHIQRPLLGLFGPQRVNVLRLNIVPDALDNPSCHRPDKSSL